MNVPPFTPWKCVFLCIFCTTSAAWCADREVVVAADGSGDFSTVQAGVNAAPDGEPLQFLIRIRPGTYREVVRVPAAKGPIKFLGENGAVVTFNNSAETPDENGKPLGTSNSASVFVESDDFTAENVTFENTFGPGSQALAINVSGGRAVFRNCRFFGWQDTVLLNSGRQYLFDCQIEGHVDFVFGAAAAFFERCRLHCRGSGYLTAASTSEKRPFGFVFSDCRVTIEAGGGKTYLGRPWRPYASVAFLRTELPEGIHPAGWDNWGKVENEKTARFFEFANTGPGAARERRVPWAYELTPRQAAALTPYRVLQQWDPGHALSADRVAALRESEREAWEDYFKRSKERLRADQGALAAETKAAGLERPLPPPSNGDFKLPSRPTRAWFASDEAKALAAAAVSFQTPSGGWSKHVALTKGARQPGMHWSGQSDEGDSWHYVGTFDNRSTTEQLRLLGGVASATGRADLRQAFNKGLDYIFDAQFPNGGWPQVYPLEGGYHDNVTFNDDAMVHILELLRDVVSGGADFGFVDAERRAKAGQAFDRGIRCILAAQIVQEGRPTVWCAQHDPLTLEPVPARRQEPASLSGGESASILRLLMEVPNPPPPVVDAILAALAWFEKYQIVDSQDAGSKDGPVWARFYDLSSHRPIFSGPKDGIIYDSLSEMTGGKGAGYDFYTQRPRDVITKRREEWRKRTGR